MTNFRATSGMFIAMIAAGVGYATPASAQATRTWVSGTGSDANPCSRTAPCQTFAGAISKTATNGEINCLDPGGFGTVNITKSITIDCAGTLGSLLSVNTNGVIVNSAGAVVTLRNIIINGANSTTGNGVRILQAGVVTIDNVVLENFGGTGTNGRGVSIETATANVRVAIINSHFVRNNSNAIESVPTAGNVLLTVDNNSIVNGGLNGVRLQRFTQATISNNVITGHTSAAGVLAEQSTVLAHLTGNIIANNVVGINNGNGGNPVTIIAGNTIFGNTSQGLLITSGSVTSQGNNAISGNSGNQTPTPPAQPLT